MTTKLFLRRQRRAVEQQHDRQVVIRRWSLTIAICVTMAVIAIGLLSKAVPQSYGFAADAQRAYTGLANHSTFHYEFTRVLAAAAGFSTTDAETIAVACEATDTNDFTGYPINGGAITVSFTNTHRIQSANRFFYHFARRAQGYPIVTQPDKTAYPNASRNTCDYFPPITPMAGTPKPKREVTAPCVVPGMGELDQLREWAINKKPLPPGRAPVVDSESTIDHGPRGNMIGGNIYALGIYIHALGDSYSHEKCMIEARFRYHKPNPYPCQTAWHLNSEFGTYVGDSTTQGAGVPFTLTAAEAVWQEILKYREARGFAGEPKWTEAQFKAFVNEFVGLTDATARVDLAVAKFNELTGETVVPPGGSSKSSSAQKKKKS